MRISTAIMAVLIVNHLMFAGLVGWLAATDRLDHDRVRDIRERLGMTIPEEEAQLAAAAAVEQEALARQAHLARLSDVADGPVQMATHLGLTEQAQAAMTARFDRLTQQMGTLQVRIDADRVEIAREKSVLDAQRKAFEEEMKIRTASMADEDFQRAVKLYEQLKPKQAKEMFKELLANNDESQVVTYLAAMKTNNAAAVLKEFKTAVEVSQATALIERLRERGVELAEMATQAARNADADAAEGNAT